jgi:hypothetical protein
MSAVIKDSANRLLGNFFCIQGILLVSLSILLLQEQDLIAGVVAENVKWSQLVLEQRYYRLRKFLDIALNVIIVHFRT